MMMKELCKGRCETLQTAPLEAVEHKGAYPTRSTLNRVGSWASAPDLYRGSLWSPKPIQEGATTFDFGSFFTVEGGGRTV